MGCEELITTILPTVRMYNDDIFVALCSSFHFHVNTAKLGPIGSEYITPAREWIIISYKDKDQNQTYLHRKMKWQIQFWKYVCVFHSCVCERFIYSHHRCAYSAAGKYVDRLLRIYKWLKDTWMHRNWHWGRAIPFLRIHKLAFPCSKT